jgi:glycogen phosphorylase
MKFQMNGALTIGTLDGANVEIREEVGPDNFFLFGLDAPGVRALKRQGYEPGAYLERSESLRGALDLIASGFFSPDDPGLHRDIVDYLRFDDPYLICADFDAYVAAQEQAAATFTDSKTWSRMVVHNIAKSGKFSSDRTISEYARDIWNVAPVVVEEPRYTPPSSR